MTYAQVQAPVSSHGPEKRAVQGMIERMSPRLTIALIDQATGWTFRMHVEARRVWLDAYGTDAPVPLSYLAGGRSLELETAGAGCQEMEQLLAVSREILPARVVAIPLGSLSAASSPAIPPCGWIRDGGP